MEQGYSDLKNLKADNDLTIVRERDDFRRLVRALEEKHRDEEKR